MEEQGMVVFEDGTMQSFGNYVCPNEKQFMYSPLAEASFIREIASTEKFK